MKLLLIVFVLMTFVFLGFAAAVPFMALRDLGIWFSGMCVALAFRAAEIRRFGKGG
jgi:hypothetical protein